MKNHTARTRQTRTQDIPQPAPATTTATRPPVSARAPRVERIETAPPADLGDVRGAFWRAVNTVQCGGGGAGRTAVYRAVAYFVSMGDDDDCYAAVERIGHRAGLGTTATRCHLRALERDGHIEAVGGRSGGRKTTRYRLANPTPTQRVPLPTPTGSVAEEVLEQVVKGGAPPSAAPPPVPEPQPDSEPRGSQPSGQTCSTAPAREPDTSAPLTGGRTLNRCDDCGHQWPAEFGAVCYLCSPIAVDREEWTCDCNGDRSWPKSRGSVCVKCGEDAAPPVGSFGADCGTAAERDHAIAEARAEGRQAIADAQAEGIREARQQFADRAQTPIERAVARENPPEPLIPITVDGLRARAAVLPPTTTTTTKPVLVKRVALPEVEVFSVEAAIAKASRNARRTARRGQS